MSIGLNDIQNAWQNLNFNPSSSYFNNLGSTYGAGSNNTANAYSTLPSLPKSTYNPVNLGDSSNMSAANALAGPSLASLQTPSGLASAASNLGSKANIPDINSIQLPSWLSSNPDSNMGELLGSYAGVGAAFDPSGQVAARNAAIGYNTSAGNQAANNAASEYANRASQSGGSALGAGVVKAQSLMPVLSQNAQLRTDAADVAAKAHQDAASLASQIAGTIGNLRTSYLSTLTGYAQGQQQLALDKYKAEQSSAGQAAQTLFGYQNAQSQAYQNVQQLNAQTQQNNATNQLGYNQLNTNAQLQQEGLAQSQNAQNIQASQFQQQLAQQQKQQSSSSALAAAQAVLAQKAPTGQYQVNNQGQVTSGMDVYNQLKSWQQSQTQAQQALKGLL